MMYNICMGRILKSISIISAIYSITAAMLLRDMVLTYFTYLSVLAIGIVMALFLILDITGKKPAYWMYVVKYIFTLCAFVTFLLFNTLLGPVQEGGLIAAWSNYCWGSFFSHVVAPLAAVADFFISNREYKPKLREAPLAIIPLLLYVAYVMILSSRGVIWYSLNNDPLPVPYNFLNYKAPCGWFGFDLGHISGVTLGVGVGYFIIVMSIIFTLIGILMLYIKGKHAVKNEG